MALPFSPCSSPHGRMALNGLNIMILIMLVVSDWTSLLERVWEIIWWNSSCWNGYNNTHSCKSVSKRSRKSWLIGKDSDDGRDWEQEEKETTEDEMAGWHHWLNGCESEWTPGVGDGQGGLACCDSWVRKESDMTERLNGTELNVVQTKNI